MNRLLPGNEEIIEASLMQGPVVPTEYKVVASRKTLGYVRLTIAILIVRWQL